MNINSIDQVLGGLGAQGHGGVQWKETLTAHLGTPIPTDPPSLTVVVVLKNVSDGLDGHRVRIFSAVAVVVVKRLWLRGIPVAHSEVDRHYEVEPEATAYVVQKGRVLEGQKRDLRGCIWFRCLEYNMDSIFVFD